MELHFGEFITKEYGLLKQILSGLNISDLLNAKLVCRDWNNAVESLLEKNPLSLTPPYRRPPLLPKPMLPDLILYQHYPQRGKSQEKCSICKQPFHVCPCLFSGPETLFLSLESLVLEIDCKTYYDFTTKIATLLVPSSSTIKVSTFCIPQKTSLFKQPITDEIVDRCVGGQQPIKCIVVFSNVNYCKSKWINELLHQIVIRQGLTFAIGGGDLKGMLFKKGFNFMEHQWMKPGIMLLTLRGSGVTAHSDILSGIDNNAMTAFMQNMASRAGPVPKGGSRVAFIAQCVDRSGIEHLESKAFISAFPSVSQYGFRAYGEYGIRSSSSDEVCQNYTGKRMKFHFNRSHTTSLTIVTFDKV